MNSLLIALLLLVQNVTPAGGGTVSGRLLSERKSGGQRSRGVIGLGEQTGLSSQRMLPGTAVTVVVTDKDVTVELHDH